MKLNEFLDLISCLREETERFCRSSRPSRDMLESLGWFLATRYHRPKCGPLFDEKVVQFVVQYGEG